MWHLNLLHVTTITFQKPVVSCHINVPLPSKTWAQFSSGAWAETCCSSSDNLRWVNIKSMTQVQVFWAWAAKLVSSSTWKPGPGICKYPKQNASVKFKDLHEVYASTSTALSVINSNFQYTVTFFPCWPTWSFLIIKFRLCTRGPLRHWYSERIYLPTFVIVTTTTYKIDV